MHLVSAIANLAHLARLGLFDSWLWIRLMRSSVRCERASILTIDVGKAEEADSKRTAVQISNPYPGREIGRSTAAIALCTFLEFLYLHFVGFMMYNF